MLTWSDCNRPERKVNCTKSMTPYRSLLFVWEGTMDLPPADPYCLIQMPRQAAIPPERHTDVSLHDGQTRSPIWLELNSLRHIRHLRTFFTGARSGSGFLVSVRREAITQPPSSQPRCFHNGTKCLRLEPSVPRLR